MTQSGQSEEPSARPAREGIVLPSDGGEPVLPGMSGAPAPAAPAGGQAWGGSWGPGQQPSQPDQGWPPAPAQHWDAPAQPPAVDPGLLPPEGAPALSYGGHTPGYGTDGPPGGYGAPASYQQHQLPQPHELRPQQHQQPQQQYPQPPASAPVPGALPPALPDGHIPSLPPAPADEGATQYIPPVQAAPADGATQYLPPVPAGPADGATQYIPPVTAGALPPESNGEETRYLGITPQQGPPAPASSDAEATQYIPPFAAQAQGQGADRHPPAEFDNLFRSGPASGDGPAGSTQQLPRIQQPDAYPGPAQAHAPAHSSYAQSPPAYGAQQPAYDPAHDDDRPRGRSRVPLIAAIGVGIVVIGVGAGALLSGGGGKDGGTDGKTVAAASPVASQGSSGAADPARQQAVELDKLLADSGSSRASVIKAVADVKGCDNLDQSASNLRDAAKQRNQLVTRLGQLSVDKLPGNADLTAALTKAWQASAAADNHYAAWADQVKGGHKACRKGHARITGETQAGNRESGTASEQKAKAAGLWNAIASKYGLTQRQPTQL
ncbi:hypothetical protein GQF42_20565 [Streptomyces broussonetiae]|uniref:Uncharacterized protein n=1 Tax=Streptomyces broussonetiae TaxID=2686304 RepID=A0A6I6MX85_9ACTN|nr:hypothetical protein [Streptomyces broussonetiae]QHA05368.1 hypothetical protein GQF42_20565 [Streptomyces broussonetiae]